MEWVRTSVREFRNTPKQKLGGQSPNFHGCIWQIQMTQMTSEHVIFCPQKTEELPKKHNEAGPPEQLLPDALSQIHYKHTIHYTLWRLLVPTNKAKGILEKLSRGNCVWLSRRSPPPPLSERKGEGSIKWWWKQNINLATWNIKTPYVFKISGLTNNGAVWAWYSDLE